MGPTPFHSYLSNLLFWELRAEIKKRQVPVFTSRGKRKRRKKKKMEGQVLEEQLHKSRVVKVDSLETWDSFATQGSPVSVFNSLLQFLRCLVVIGKWTEIQSMGIDVGFWWAFLSFGSIFCRLLCTLLLHGVCLLWLWTHSLRNWPQTIRMFSFSLWMWMKLR